MEELNKEVVEETTEQPIEEVVENKVDQPRNEKGQFKSKFESAGDDSVVKVDLSQPPPTQESEEVKEEPIEEEKENIVEEPEVKNEEVIDTQENTPVLEEITTEDLVENVEKEIDDAIIESEITGKPLPENVQKLVNFMDETGGDLQDYVNLNRDIEKMDDSEILDEYYRNTKSHLTPEERSFLLEDNFGVNEDVDDERTIRKKKIALKEQVAMAKAHLDRQKSKYYEDIKAGSKLTPEQQKAIDFFNRHKKESEKNQRDTEAFKQRTNTVFNDNFKGFDFKVGDKKYRYNVKDVDKVRETQSDLNNFVNKFANKDKTGIEDVAGYHKSIFTAMNPDAIANHFYEQGKADATKARVARDKNVNTNPRQTHGEVNVGGVKYRVLGDSASDISNRSFKIKSNKKRN
tara:strand:- start:1333 stop:2544 length:1212 start_codon:yes stop_codon:yes gene_type:complete